MDKLNPNDPETMSADIVSENLTQLKALFPEAFVEGKVDFDVLKQLLGGAVDEREEKYGLNWHGKRKSRQLALTPSTGTLRPCPEDSVDWDTTQNLMIEGDNLEVLKLLQKSYAGKVKLIYIDPPYNKDADVIYPDDFARSIENYLMLTGQVDSDGRKLSNISESSGRKHTDWLNMLYPRLLLAKNLLREDGTIFVSCDDSEVHHMKLLLHEAFGEENFIAIIANVNNPKGRSDDRFIATSHEYILIAARNKNLTDWGGFAPEEKIIRRYNKNDSTGLLYREIDLRKTGDSDRRTDRPDMFYYFYWSQATQTLRVSREKVEPSQDELEIIPLREDGVEGRWRWGFETASQSIDSLIVRYMPNRQIWGIFEKDYLEGRSLVKPTSSWTFKEVNSERGSEQFVELGFPKESFPRPKPIGTLQRILDIGSQSADNPDIVLDFFAGSGTTGHAVYLQNANDGGNRRFILVQLPEPLGTEKVEQETAALFCDSLGLPRNIAELTKERLRRAAKKVNGESPLLENDLGFRVFKLDTSNIAPWDTESTNIEQSLLAAVSNIKTDRIESDILNELLIKLGLDLCVPLDSREISGKTVHSVGAGALLVCLSPKIDRSEVESLALGIVEWHKELDPAGESSMVFLDSAFADDVSKTNMTAILGQYGLLKVRSL